MMCGMSNPQLVGGGETSGKITPRWTFADRLRKIRREYVKVNQEQMADKLGIDKGSYANWEYGRSYPRNLVAVASRIEILSGIKAEWVLGMADPEPDVQEDEGPDAEAVERDAIVQRILTATLREQDGGSASYPRNGRCTESPGRAQPVFVAPSGLVVTHRDSAQLVRQVRDIA